MNLIKQAETISTEIASAKRLVQTLRIYTKSKPSNEIADNVYETITEIFTSLEENLASISEILNGE